MWKCLNCGAMNEQEFCTVCGAKQQVQQTPEKPIQAKNTTIKILLVCIVILLALLCLIGGYFVIKTSVIVPRVMVEQEPAVQTEPALETDGETEEVAPFAEPEKDPSDMDFENVQYFTYHNTYGGFSVDVPAFLEEEDSDDTAVYYVSEDKSVTMDIGCWEAGRVFSGVNALYDHIKSGIAYDINYDRKKDNWFVISGEDSGVIYYQYHILKPNGMACHFILTYPKTLEKEFDDIVTHIYRSFKTE